MKIICKKYVHKRKKDFVKLTCEKDFDFKFLPPKYFIKRSVELFNRKFKHLRKSFSQTNQYYRQTHTYKSCILGQIQAVVTFYFETYNITS